MNVVEIPVIDYRDTVALLRAIADDIEIGASSAVKQGVLVIEREDGTDGFWQVYDFGSARGDKIRAAGVLTVGAQILMDKVLGA